MHIIQALVLECDNQTLTVKGLPFWFEGTPNKWRIPGTDIKVIDYVGTEDIGMLYLNKPIVIDKNKHINLSYITQ